MTDRRSGSQGERKTGQNSGRNGMSEELTKDMNCLILRRVIVILYLCVCALSAVDSCGAGGLLLVLFGGQ